MQLADKIVRDKGLKLFESLSAGVLMTGLDKKIFYANRAFCKAYHMKKKDLIGKKCSAILHPDAPQCRECWKTDNIQIQSEIENQPCQILLSCASLEKDFLLRIIHDITRILSDVAQLKKDLSELRLFVETTIGTEGPLVVCARCRKIRLRDGSWIPSAQIDKTQIKAGLSHGECPSCSKQWLEELRDIERQLP